MVREDWGRTLTELLDERFIAPLAAWARRTRHAAAHPGLRHSAGDGVEQCGRRSAGRRGAPVARAHRVALGVVGQPPVRQARGEQRDVDVAALAVVSRDAARHEGRSRPPLPAGHHAAHRARLAIHTAKARPIRAGGSTPPASSTIAIRGGLAMPDVSRYLQRVSAVLRQGRPGNDVALYLPIHDGYAHASLGKMHLLELVRERLGGEVIGSILDAGYGFDLVDDRALAHHAPHRRPGAGDRRGPLSHGRGPERRGDAGRDAGRARALRRGRRDRRGHATGAGRGLPGRSTVAAREAFATRAKDLFSRADGRAIVTTDAGAALRRALNERVPPPIRMTSTGSAASEAGGAVESDIGVVERRFGEESLFFVVNTSNVARPLTIGLGAPGRKVEWWDPLGGTEGDSGDRCTGSITLTLAPYESCFLVRTASAGQPDWPSALDRPEPAAAGARVLGPWQVTAGTETWTSTATSLAGWDQRESTRYFSGVATYETTVTLSAAESEARADPARLRRGHAGRRVPDAQRLSRLARRAHPRGGVGGRQRRPRGQRHLGAAVPHGHHRRRPRRATTASASASATPR